MYIKFKLWYISIVMTHLTLNFSSDATKNVPDVFNACNPEWFLFPLVCISSVFALWIDFRI